jgi:alpha-mannosidase
MILDAQAALNQLGQVLANAGAEARQPLERFMAELDFAVRMAAAHPERAAEWAPLLEQNVNWLVQAIREGVGPVPVLVAEAEVGLAPLGAAAKEYTIYCCGHGHIDMNWMWSWPETVSVTYDTFATMDQLMDEFPEFHYSQSQASVYWLTEKYAPELFQRIRARVQEGRWEITGSQWVEGDKNLASGEILCRHLLYTKRWFRDHLGVPLEAIKIDWEPDTFGHCWTLPGILQRGGVTRYYHHRANGPRLQATASGQASQLFWWEGKDGSRVLTYDDSPNGYNCEINPGMTRLLFDMERNTGLKRLLWVYGVGDHGGGPTRRHLRAAQDMQGWPLWPNVRLTTTDDFFSAVEADIEEQGLELPIHRDELNFVFEGCYTTEARIKFANRKGENDLVDTEVTALVAGRLSGLPYPADVLRECWRRSMFIQFHDILPGSGVKETVEHALGLFQENLANTGMIRTRGLRGLAARVDTSALAPTACGPDLGLGAGVGNGAWWGGVSNLGAGAEGSDPFVVFNPAPFARDEMVSVKVWNRDLPGALVVRDAAGNVAPAQVLDRGHYWGHSFATVAFPVTAPAAGYRACVIEAGNAAAEGAAYTRETGRPSYGLGYVGAQPVNPMVIGNEHLEMIVCGQNGGIISLVDRATGTELVEEGCVLGALDRELEAPHGMTAWQLGPIVDSVQPLEGSVLQVTQNGPNIAAVRLTGKYNDSEYNLTISLAAGSRQVSFDLDVNWLERGDNSLGVPVLRATFPLAIEDGSANFEIACGTIERDADGEESPALNWADLTGLAFMAEEDTLAGATLLNDCKYGHQLSEDTLRLTLLRSSYDPDPLPEYGRHAIRYALVPHLGAYDATAAIQAGYAFNHALIPVGTTAHEGALPAEFCGLEVLTPGIMVSALKQAEDGDAVILRLYEFAGQDSQAQVRIAASLVAAGSACHEVSLLEQPLVINSAAMNGDVVSVTVPAYGIATVRLGG